MSIKKSEGTKKCVIKRKLKFKDYKNCLKASQIISKVNYLEKKKVDIDCLKEDQRKFIEKNKLTLKTQKKNVKVKGIMFFLKKLIRLLWVRMMIKEYNQLIR